MKLILTRKQFHHFGRKALNVLLAQGFAVTVRG